MRWPLHLCGTIHDLTLSASWDARHLIEQVDRRLGKLCDLGVRPGDMVAIVHGSSAPFVADLLAVWSCGAVAVLLDPMLAKSELDTLIRFVRPRVAISDKIATEIQGINTQCLDGIAVPRPGYSVGHIDELAIVLVTSGTTGTPKAVGLSHRALRSRLHHNLLTMGEAAIARTLVTLPTSFGHGLIGNVLTALFAGGDIVFPPTGATLPLDLGRLIEAHQITFLTSVPALWRMALKMSNEPKNGSLRRVHVGSAPLSEQLWRDIIGWTGAETVNCYGLTEVANWFSGASSLNDAPRSGLVGRPWGGEAAILHHSGAITSQGEGELLIKSPSLMDGYLHRPDLTQECKIHGWYRTGDFGAIESDGQIVLQGRLKDEINRAGTKIQPAELDMLIESHPAVDEACTFAVPDPIAGEIVAVAVRLKSGMTETSESLTLWCRERIRRVAVPEQWHFVSELPRTPRGKMRRDQVYMALAGEKK
jgi:acyl-CoA synthetase (AMP-forming)/AMP-acid ligase II